MRGTSALVKQFMVEGQCARVYVESACQGFWTIEKGRPVMYSLKALRDMGFTAHEIREMFHEQIVFSYPEWVNSQ